MLCMKCGREIEAEQVFCGECLAEMEKYPVKPGTVVTIPLRPAPNQQKKQAGHRRHPAAPLEEQVKRLKKRLTAAYVALALTFALAAGLCGVLVAGYLDGADELRPGQNYSSASSTQPEAGG